MRVRVPLTVAIAVLLAAASACQAAPLQLLLPLRADSAGLARFATAVSTPGGPRYGRYASMATLGRRFGAPRGARARVLRVLRTSGARHAVIDASGFLARATLRVGAAERLFHTRLVRRRTPDGTRFVRPAPGYARAAAAGVPGPLHGLVTGVIGLDTRPLPVRTARRQTSRHRHSGTSRGCRRGRATKGFTPNQFLTAYGFDALHAAGDLGQGERVAIVGIDGFRRSDITAFAHCFGTTVPPIVRYRVGIRHALRPGGEETLDLETIAAAAPSLDGIDAYETDNRSGSLVRALAAALRGPGPPPQVFSSSIGLCEQFARYNQGGAGIVAGENELALAAARGVTVVAASGDDGSSDCVRNNGTEQHRLAVDYPASSPWVTSVGGTNLVLGQANRIMREPVWNDGGFGPRAILGAGGGGRSRLFARPHYQAGVVAPGRREVPDVALLADSYPGYAGYCTAVPDCVRRRTQSGWSTVAGTSAAAPLLAGAVAVVDQALREGGHPDLGQLNPLLYAVGRSADREVVFHDVTRGNNDLGRLNGDGPLGCCTARAGFDAASGWGSVDAAALAQAASALTPGAATLTLSAPARQHAVRAHAFTARLSCSAACAVRVTAEVGVGPVKPFRIGSAVLTLAAAGETTARLPLSHAQTRLIRTALRHRVPVNAALTAASVDGRGRAANALIRLRRCPRGRGGRRCGRRPAP